MHPGRGTGLAARRLGQQSGAETETLTDAQMPSHSHTMRASNQPGNSTVPARRSWARASGGSAYRKNSSSKLANMASATLRNAGGSRAHNNMQPYLTMNFIIALQGLYPSRG